MTHHRAGSASPGSGYRADPAGWIASLARELREEGLGTSSSESTLAGDCAGWLDADDPLDVLHGLRGAFCSAQADLDAFERCFWRRWNGAPRPVSSSDAGADSAQAADSGAAIGLAYSAAEHVTRRSFASVKEDELREFDAWIEKLMVRLSARRSRRLEPGGRRGPVDLRRSAASAVRTEGEWLRLFRRQRRLDPPRIVVLCDVSGSMERYSRFLVRFLLATGRARDIQTFAFSTRLTHLTPWLASTPVDRALEELRARGWSNGTRIGECLETFLARYGRSMLGQRTFVVILSDGLDQGEIEPLVRAMRTIQRRARRVIWLNPLLESSRYVPEARGMRAALPFVDEFATGHNLEALSKLPGMLRL